LTGCRFRPRVFVGAADGHALSRRTPIPFLIEYSGKPDFISAQGKPVVRRGRKAMGPLEQADRQAADGMKGFSELDQRAT
jgi:hypothetical protein